MPPVMLPSALATWRHMSRMMGSDSDFVSSIMQNHRLHDRLCFLSNLFLLQGCSIPKCAYQPPDVVVTTESSTYDTLHPRTGVARRAAPQVLANRTLICSQSRIHVSSPRQRLLVPDKECPRCVDGMEVVTARYTVFSASTVTFVECYAFSNICGSMKQKLSVH